MTNQRPTVPPTSHSKGFWDAVSKGELTAQKCDHCEHLQFYPQPMCPKCKSGVFSWHPLSGKGHIYSYTVAHRAFHPFWKEHVPYVIATIELDEGVRIVSDILSLDPIEVAIGHKVEAYFEDSPGLGLMPRFRLCHSEVDP